MVIETFVFFDIETTGLPFQERNRTKITELCFLAVRREDIEKTALGDTPLVSKLTLYFNPQKCIESQAAKLTGLSNKQLENAPKFKRRIQTIDSFLEELKQPVCLVAHNGEKFDYKILLAEYNDADASVSDDLLCVDSLVVFRKLLTGTNICYETLKYQEVSNEELTDDESGENNESDDGNDESDDNCSSRSDISFEDLFRIQTPKKKARPVQIKRPKIKIRESFKLGDLYQRLLNKNALNAHRAEDDCLMLLQCVVALKEEFIKWADKNCKRLSDIEALQRY